MMYSNIGLTCRETLPLNNANAAVNMTFFQSYLKYSRVISRRFLNDWLHLLRNYSADRVLRLLGFRGEGQDCRIRSTSALQGQNPFTYWTYCSGTEVPLAAPTIQPPGNGPADLPREEGGASYLPDVKTQADPSLGSHIVTQSVLFVRLTCTQLLH